MTSREKLRPGRGSRVRMKAAISFSLLSEMRIPFSISRRRCFSRAGSQCSTTSAARGCGAG